MLRSDNSSTPILSARVEMPLGRLIPFRNDSNSSFTKILKAMNTAWRVDPSDAGTGRESPDHHIRQHWVVPIGSSFRRRTIALAIRRENRSSPYR